jgi:negative regulator of sigma E activity
MDKDIHYKMSLLLDGELTAQETVELWKSIEQNPALAAQWKRYNQVRSAMNSLPAVSVRPDLVDSVHQALLSEPTVMVPNRQSKAKNGSKPKLVTLRRTGMIAATAVLGMMVYGYQQHMQQIVPVTHPPATAADLMVDNVVAGNDAIVTLTEPVHASASRVDYSSTQIPSERAFNDYLVTHGEYSSYAIDSQPLVAPVTRLISYNTEH